MELILGGFPAHVRNDVLLLCIAGAGAVCAVVFGLLYLHTYRRESARLAKYGEKLGLARERRESLEAYRSRLLRTIRRSPERASVRSFEAMAWVCCPRADGVSIEERFSDEPGGPSVRVLVHGVSYADRDRLHEWLSTVVPAGVRLEVERDDGW